MFIFNNEHMDVQKMKKLLERSERTISGIPDLFTRYLYDKIDWSDTLIEIYGARGVGKSSLLLQYLKKAGGESHIAVYLSLDDLYFTTNSLLDAGTSIAENGGRILGLDEVHKYHGWQQEVYKLHQKYPGMQIISVASSVAYSAIEAAIENRHLKRYRLSGLSYREYLAMAHHLQYEPVTIRELLQQSSEKQSVFPSDFRPMRHFREYLFHGYYPGLVQKPDSYPEELQRIVRLTTEYDMAELNGFDVRNAKKLLRLLGFLARSAPAKPNISRLSEQSGIHRNSLVGYLHYLEQAGMIVLLYPPGDKITRQQKPEQVYLHNPNLLNLVCDEPPLTDSIRKTFLVSQLQTHYELDQPMNGGVGVEQSFYFSTDPETDPNRQISGFDPIRYLPSDTTPENTEIIRVPVWMFGLLY